MLQTVPWSYWLGCGLILWCLLDLIRGQTYLWLNYVRKIQPGMYWLTMLIWALIAASCFIFPHWPFY